MKIILPIIILLALLSSCKKFNPEEGIPEHINISEITFHADNLQGTDSAKITDAWLYVDDELIGAFEMPAKIPVLTSGNHQIMIRPGIILNGIAATRSINPFFTSYKQTVNFSEGSSQTIYPTSKYIDGLVFPWNSRGEENFEDGSISIDSISGSTVSIKKSDEDVYEGLYSGKIALDTAHRKFAGQSTNAFVLPKLGSPVIMEINIKNTNTPLAIGMFVNLYGGKVIKVDHLLIKPGPHWKKIYINFTQLVSYYTDAENYRVTFNAALDASQQQGNIYLDNIKIMHQ